MVLLDIKKIQAWQDRIPPAIAYTAIAAPVCFLGLYLGMIAGFYAAILFMGAKVTSGTSMMASLTGLPVGMVAGTSAGVVASIRLFYLTRWGRKVKLVREINKLEKRKILTEEEAE